MGPDDEGAASAELDPPNLSGLFAPPRWLTDLGRTAWLAVGVTLLLVGAPPIAYGAAGGALFGAVGLILAAPLTSAVTRIAADLARGRAETATA